MSRTSYLLLAGCVIVVLLHLWGTIQPSHDNWGVHFLGFYDTSIQICVLILLILFLIPKVQTFIINRVDKIVRSLSKLPIVINFVIATGILLGAGFLFQVKMHLLGDGAILLRSVPLGIGNDQITQSFRNQPLMFWIYKWAMALHPVDASPDTYTVYATIDTIGALIFLGLIFWGMRTLQKPLLEKFLLGCFLLFGAGSQFFFGYVENYVLQYVTTTAYVITGWLVLEKKISIVIPVLCFVLMVLLHLGDLVFLPSLMLLIILNWKKNKLKATLFLGAVGLTGIVVLYLVGFNIIDMTRHLRTGTVDFLQLFTAIGGNFPYPMFSFMHLLDWFNLNLLVVPSGIFLVIALIPALPKDSRWKNPVLIYLLVSVCCGLFFTWVINSAIGMARDWDMFSSYFVPLIILPIYLLSQPISIEPKRYIIVCIVFISFLHWVSWIGVNANAERHLSRIKMLNSPKFLSLTAQLAYDEALANYFFDTQQYNDSRKYYEHFLQIDSTNPRIIGNISDVYRRLGERDRYFNMLKRAVVLNSPDPGVYSNLGVEYANRGDTTAAIALNEKAILINPSMQKAHANLGILYAGKKNYQLANTHFTAAINLGMREPVLYRYAADVCLYLPDFERAIQYYDTYLSTNPNDEGVRNLRNKVFQALAGIKKHQ